MLPQNDVPLLPWSAMIESMARRDVLLPRAERRNASVFPENGSPLPASAMMASTASGASSQSPSGAGGTAEAKARVKSMTKLNSPVPADWAAAASSLMAANWLQTTHWFRFDESSDVQNGS